MSLHIAEECGALINVRLARAHGERTVSTVEMTDEVLAAYTKRIRIAERERCAKLCESERAEHMPVAALNNGRASDFAFGSVNSAERIAAAIRSSEEGERT